MKKLFVPIVVLLFAWGIAIRAVEVINGNYLFGFDHGRDYLAAYSIAVDHKLTLIGAEVGAGAAGLSHIFHGPGYYYLIALMYLFFRGDPYGGLLLMFFFGVSALFVGFLTTKKIFGREIAVVILMLLATSPLLVTQSRFMWNHHPSTLFIILTIYFSYLIGKTPRMYAPLAVFTAGFIYHFELAIAVPLIFAVAAALPLVYRIKDVKTYVYSAIAGFAAFFPFVLFESRHGWQAIRSLLTYATPEGPVASDIWILRIIDHMKPYIANAANTFAHEHGLLPYELYVVLSIALFISLIVFAWKTKARLHRMLFRVMLLMLVVSYGILLLLNNLIWDFYLIQAHVIYIYVFAYAFILSIKTIRASLWSKVAAAALLLFLLSIALASSWRMMISYTYDIRDYGGREKIKGKKAAIDYVYKEAGGKPFSVFTFMAPIYTYPYDYLFKTYAKNTYGYEPGNEKKGLVYLIIEEDTSKPWTYKGWLETVIVGGEIIKTVTLPSGQIIQVRQFP